MIRSKGESAISALVLKESGIKLWYWLSAGRVSTRFGT